MGVADYSAACHMAGPTTRRGKTMTCSSLHVLAVASVALLSAHSLAAPPKPKASRKLNPFDYTGVTLLNSRLARQFEEVKAYYLRIPNDDLLHGYRVRAGLPAPGRELGGWYTDDSGNAFPQIVSGFARMYAASGDPACKEKTDYLIAEWARCIAPDGFFFYSQRATSWHYYFEKVVGMLVDAHRYTGNRDALKHLRVVLDWGKRTLDRTRDYANADGDRRNARHRWGEWYTVSENLYRAWLATGDNEYRDFAEVWEYPAYWDLFARKADIFGVRPDGGQTGSYHAYSHVNTLCSAAAAYLVRGDKHYLDTLVNAYEFLQERQTYATGGYGAAEQLVPDAVFARTLDEQPNHFEVQCGSWAAFKLSKYLMTFTGDARYGDWVELLTLNAIGADIPMSPDGRPMYYANYSRAGAAKELYPSPFPCCAGTRPNVVADYADQVFFHSADSLCVNLYTSATVTWKRGGRTVEITQSTRFPEEEGTRITVRVAKPTRFALRFRVPGWLAGPITASVNGRPAPLETGELHWGVLEREWKDGDVVELTLPMALHLSVVDKTKGMPVALMYGPVVLAARSADDPSSKIDFANIEASLVRLPVAPLEWRLARDPDVLVRPFYTFQEGERYWMYLG
jgi:DUF1680 family protein